MWDLILKGISYLVEIPIEKRNSDHSPKLRVTLKAGRYALSTNNVYYSHEDKYASFRQAFAKLAPAQAEVRKVLVLGYGLGSIPHILKTHHHIDAQYAAVEVDPIVVGMAQRYGNLPKGSTVSWFNSDALAFVTFTNETFDLICIDIFIDDKVPVPFLREEFLHDTYKLLNPNGKLLFSHLTTTADQQATVQRYFDTVFKAVFPNATIIDTKGNWVLVGEK